jgi:hypothetical protein
MGILRLFSFLRVKQSGESEDLEDQIAEVKRRFLSEVASTRGQRMLALMEEEKRKKEAIVARDSGNERRYQLSLKRCVNAEVHVKRIDDTIEILQRNIDLIENLAQVIRLDKITTLAGTLLGELKHLNPNIEKSRENFEVSYVQMAAHVKKIGGDIQLPASEESGDIMQKIAELKERLARDSSQ